MSRYNDVDEAWDEAVRDVDPVKEKKEGDEAVDWAIGKGENSAISKALAAGFYLGFKMARE